MEQRLEQELKRDYHIITADKRLDQVARDFVMHYSKAWESGKAMLVCIDKITCVRMYDRVVKYWDERIAELEAELPSAMDERDEQYRHRQIEWMGETRMAVVVSEEQGEVEKFRKWGLDITPHRRLIKEGMDLPEAMRRQPQFRNMQRLALDDVFKEAEHPFRIAIVCAMWPTGFDVPSLPTLYLDKPLKAHTLLQAIARANRVNEGKNNGMIVDYCGILKNLRKALATFAGVRNGGRDGQGGPTEPAKADEELLADLTEAISLVRTFLAERGASLDDMMTKTGFERNAAFAKEELRRARQRVASFLLRYRVELPKGTRRWSVTFLRWLDKVSFTHRSSQIALREYLHAEREMARRVERLEVEIHAWATESEYAPVIQALQALRGVRKTTAVTLVAEVGQFSRFRNPEQLMAYTGVVPREYSSGLRSRQGGISKTGNRHIRFVLGEAAWAYRFKPAVKEPLRKDQW